MGEDLVGVRRDGRVAVVTLKRPAAMNAISTDLAEALGRDLAAISADPEASVVVLEAEGEKAFSVGANLKERAALDDEGWSSQRTVFRATFDALRSLRQPTIASVFGYVLGGGFELALSCDLIVAADDAVFGLPEVRIGIIPGNGGTQLLARRAGIARAKDVILTGRRISAEEAAAMGFVARVVPRASLRAATRELADDVALGAPMALQEAKGAIDRGAEMSLDEALDLEEQAWRHAVASDDRREGIAAFVEKREPRWTGR